MGFYKKAEVSQTSWGDFSRIDVFNDLTLEFGVETFTPAGQNLEVSIDTPGPNIILIFGSLRTDLPVFYGKTQTITYSSNTIKIRNVGSLTSSGIYRVFAKVAFPSFITIGSYSGFAVSIKTIHDGEQDILLGKGAAADFFIVRNYEYLDFGYWNGYHNKRIYFTFF